MKEVVLVLLLGYAMAAEWSYEDVGEDMWKDTFPTCGGERQSPIDIPASDSAHLRYENLGTISFSGYDNMNSVDLILSNNGHTAIVTIEDNDKQTYIEGGGLSDKYIALQFHFHWGSDDHHGSEHTFRGKMFPLELHIVHYKDSYGNVTNALQNPDGAAVIGVFFEISETDNPKLNPVINSLGAIKDKDGSQSVLLNFTDILGEKTDAFYRYEGSLTTPGCTEAVIWTVLEGKNYISSNQLAKFRALKSNAAGDLLTLNYRPVQPLHARVVSKNYDTAIPKDWHWGYGHGSEGPANWQYYYPTCSGHRQSPINIPPLYDDRIADFDEEMMLDSLEFVNYDQPLSGKIKNNGHTVQVDIESPEIYIRKGGLEGKYRAAQFHFHWGADDGHGSEHTVNSHSFPLELHIVHYKVSYGSVSEALKRDDGLAVIGFLFQASASNNSNYNTIIDKLNSVQFKDQMDSIDGFTLEHLTLSNLKKNSSSGVHYPYYRYLGGLTTPPCSQVVIWTVINEPVPLGISQLQEFRHLAHVTETPTVQVEDLILENYRPVQDLVQRHVFISSRGLIGQPGMTTPVGFDWGYEGDSGPQNWKYYYPTCEGERQSPIDIPSPTSDKLIFDQALGLNSLEFVNYDVNITGTIKNNGHTVQVDIESPEIYIHKGGLNGRYRAVQFHFHWGADNGHGSEHTLNGRSFPLELHIVHYKESYGNISAAVKQSDGLAVIGFVFDVSSSVNKGYSDIVSRLQDVKYKGQSNAISGINLEGITIRELKKNATTGFHNPFYRYMGGLTTPPCSEVATWTVMHQPIPISSSQLQEFRKLLHVTEGESHMPNAHNMFIKENYRPVQMLHQRVVHTSYPVLRDTSFAPGLNYNVLWLSFLLFVSILFR